MPNGASMIPATGRSLSGIIRTSMARPRAPSSQQLVIPIALPSSQQLDVPVEPVAPGIVQIVGREAAAMLLQLPGGRPDRRDMELHSRLMRRAPALAQVARRAGGGDIL